MGRQTVPHSGPELVGHPTWGDALLVMGLADAPLMGSVAEGTVMVVEASSAHRSAIEASVARLRSANSRMVGVVLNKFESRRNGYGYAYAYNYNYGSQTASENDSQDGRKIVLVK